MHAQTLVSRKQNSLMQPVMGIFCYHCDGGSRFGSRSRTKNIIIREPTYTHTYIHTHIL